MENKDNERERVCNYCHKQEHWKANSQFLGQKPKSVELGKQLKGVCLTAPASPVIAAIYDLDSYCRDSGPTSFDSYRPFIRKGFVFMVEGMTILRDKTALSLSFPAGFFFPCAGNGF